MKTAIIGLTLLLAAFSQAASARDDGALNGFRNHALPVLVRVNDQGKVTDVQPSVTLTPRTDRLLRASLDEMISKPAMVKDRPVSSIFVIQLALNVDKQADGKYRAHFSYVSSLPVPAGQWYWVHINGHRLALAEDNGRDGSRYLRSTHGINSAFGPWSSRRVFVSPASNSMSRASRVFMPAPSRSMIRRSRGR